MPRPTYLPENEPPKRKAPHVIAAIIGGFLGSILLAFLALNVVAGFGFGFWQIVGLGWILAVISSARPFAA